uniref:Uncharacterized protein n=1 Tax=Theileria annulata TaxID=5874 RepID=A0A3B0N2I4_THEAN
MFITRRLLGPGHPVSNPLPVPTLDSPNRYYRFKLRPIRKDYWNVLCFANSEKLRKTSIELINNYLSTGKQLKYLEYKESSNDFMNKNDKIMFPDESSGSEDKFSKETLKSKTKGFWIVYSKRFKESIHLLSVSDIANILKSFHIYNKDSGEYVVAVLELQRRVKELDAKSLLDILWVLSRRLKQNTQKEFFKSIANQVPNVLYSLNGNDVVNLLWNLYNSGYTDVEICNIVYLKFMDYIDELNEQDLSSACMAFGRYGYRNMDLYSKIEPRISKNCNASWGLFMASIDVTELISERTETFINSLEGSPRWKLKVWKTILNSTNCHEDLKRNVDEHLKNT